AGLMVRSFLALHAVTPGFTHPEQIQTVDILIPEAQIREAARVVQMQADILDKLSAIPGVAAAAFAAGLPMEYHNGVPVAVEGKTPVDQIPPNRTIKQVSPNLFAAQGTRLIAGRDFTWNGVFSYRRVAIVSENIVRENWGEPRNAPGKQIRMGTEGPWTEIVGVAENVHENGLTSHPPRWSIYAPAWRRRIPWPFAVASP